MVRKELNLKKWKEFGGIFVEGMWKGNYRIPELRMCGNRNFHGNFIPEIPYVMMLRYTKPGDIVLDPMAGSGTTGDVGKLIDRRVEMFDLNPVREDIVKADAKTYDFGNEKYDLVIWHPPYANIIKFSDSEDDLSNYDYKEFLDLFRIAAFNITRALKLGHYLILVCGEIYRNGEEIPLGFYCSEIIREFGFVRKAIIVKDYGETAGGNVSNPKNKNLQWYRHLKNGTWFICGDFIFVMKKVRKEVRNELERSRKNEFGIGD